MRIDLGNGSAKQKQQNASYVLLIVNVTQHLGMLLFSEGLVLDTTLEKISYRKMGVRMSSMGQHRFQCYPCRISVP